MSNYGICRAEDDSILWIKQIQSPLKLTSLYYLLCITVYDSYGSFFTDTGQDQTVKGNCTCWYGSYSITSRSKVYRQIIVVKKLYTPIFHSE